MTAAETETETTLPGLAPEAGSQGLPCLTFLWVQHTGVRQRSGRRWREPPANKKNRVKQGQAGTISITVCGTKRQYTTILLIGNHSAGSSMPTGQDHAGPSMLAQSNDTTERPLQSLFQHIPEELLTVGGKG